MTTLCNVCRQALRSHESIPRTAPEDAICKYKFYKEKHRVPHHPSFPSLKTSVDSNCLICTEFWNQQRPLVKTWLEFEASSPGDDIHLQGHTTTSIHPDINVDRPGTQMKISTFVERASESTGGQKYHTRHILRVDGYPYPAHTSRRSASFLSEIHIRIEPEGKVPDFLLDIVEKAYKFQTNSEQKI